MLRTIYLISAAFSAANAVWMILFPLSWYHDLPAAIPHTGPFNAHFVRDIGLAYALSAVGFIWCADSRRPGTLPVHWGVTLFFFGHALVHVVEIVAGILPPSHWQLDASSVFTPPVLLLILAIPSVRRRLGEEGGPR